MAACMLTHDTNAIRRRHACGGLFSRCACALLAHRADRRLPGSSMKCGRVKRTSKRSIEPPTAADLSARSQAAYRYWDSDKETTSAATAPSLADVRAATSTAEQAFAAVSSRPESPASTATRPAAGGCWLQIERRPVGRLNFPVRFFLPGSAHAGLSPIPTRGMSAP